MAGYSFWVGAELSILPGFMEQDGLGNRTEQQIMGFRLRRNEFFKGMVVEPDGQRREHVVVGKGTRAQVVSPTLIEASRRGWDWRIHLLRKESDEDGTVTELACWSEVAGDDLPPLSRADVPGLD